MSTDYLPHSVNSELSSEPIPFWAEPLPLPPEVDFLADVQEDLKFAALLLAVRKVADKRGTSVKQQLDIWNDVEVQHG